MAQVLGVFDDLLLGSNIVGRLAAGGHRAILAAPEHLFVGEAEVLVVDLGSPIFDGIALVDQLRAKGELDGVLIVGIYSHVDEAAKLRAEAARFDLVVPRSRMAREGPGLVSRLVEAFRDADGHGSGAGGAPAR